MSENQSVPRSDILSINFKEIKKLLTSGQSTKFYVGKDKEYSPAVDQNTIQPWLTSSKKQFLLSRHKLGCELLKHCRNGFSLNDPHLHGSRFFVDYHRLHDPALKRYYNSIPVKNRLKHLELINKANDAICSNKEFVEYIRYLDGIRAEVITKSLKSEKENKLSTNLRKLNANKQRESNVFRQNKYKHEPKSTVNLNEEKKIRQRKQMGDERKAVERANKIKAEYRDKIKHKNLTKDAVSVARKQSILQNETKRRLQMKKSLDTRQMQAERRKETMHNEKIVSKLQKNFDFFEKCMAVNEENHFKNIELFQLYKEDQQNCQRVRQKQVREIQEFHENEMVKIRHQIALRKYKKEQCDVLVEKIMKRIPAQMKKYQHLLDSNNGDEVSRRFSMINRQLVADCVETTHGIFQHLHFSASAAEIINQVMELMRKDVLLVPEIGAMECVLVRQRIAEMISQMVNEIKDNHLQRIISEQQGKITQDTDKVLSEDEQDDEGGKTVAFAVEQDTEINSDKSDFESKKATYLSSRKIDKIYDIDAAVQRELKQFFEFITNVEFTIPEKFNTRDFIHLYDFQKYFLHKTLDRLEELIKMKQEHDWIEFENSSWRNIVLDLNKISSDAAEVVMSYTRTPEEIGKGVRQLSRYICIEVDKVTAPKITDDKLVEKVDELETETETENAIENADIELIYIVGKDPQIDK